MNKQIPILVLVGPTAVGKTKMSVELAKRLNGEIINADSTQVYRGLDVATAKVTEEEKEGIPHHLFDIRALDQEYSVYDYQKDCRTQIAEIQKRGHVPILVGGTGLYIKAALYDYQFEEEVKEQSTYDQLSDSELYEKVKEGDPETDIHPHNRKRLIRALQYFEQHHLPLSEKEKAESPLYSVSFIGLTTNREYLYERINHRVGKMMEDGLLEEAKEIYENGIRSKAILTPIGYKQLFPYFEGTKSLEECLDQIRKDSRHYAKRQYTWFRHQLPVVWYDVNFTNFEETVLKVMDAIKRECN